MSAAQAILVNQRFKSFFERFCHKEKYDYVWESEKRIVRIAKCILSLIIFPIALYKMCQVLAGRFIVSAQSEPNVEKSPNLQKVSISVDGTKIEAFIFMNPTHQTDQWVLFTNGNGGVSGNLVDKTSIDDREFDTEREILNGFEANGLFFNYPGVGGSEGFSTRSSMVKSYKAVLSYLENEKKAKEIIGYGFSIGGAVQAEALEQHKFKEKLMYYFITDRTFTDLESCVSEIVHPILGKLVKLLGWNFNPKKSLEKLEKKQVILFSENDEMMAKCSLHKGLKEQENLVIQELNLFWLKGKNGFYTYEHCTPLLERDVQEIRENLGMIRANNPNSRT